MRHVVFAVVVSLFVVTIGQNWFVYSAALLIAAWVRHGGRLDARVW